MRKLLSTLTAFAVSAFIVDAAMAQQVSTWDGSADTDWTNAANWTATGGAAAPPDNNDLVVIPDRNGTANDPTGNVAGNYAQIRVESNGYLRIDAASALNVTGSAGLVVQSTGEIEVRNGTLRVSNGGSHAIDGLIRLNHDTAARLEIDAAAVDFAGAGRIKGEDQDALVLILTHASTQRVFESNVLIDGMLKIQGQTGSTHAGRFVNGSNGVVQANAAGVLEILGTAGSIDDEDNADWKVTTDSGAILRFSVAPDCLDGDFTVTAGTLDIDANVATRGELLSFLGGSPAPKIDVATGVYFQAGLSACP